MTEQYTAFAAVNDLHHHGVYYPLTKGECDAARLSNGVGIEGERFTNGFALYYKTLKRVHPDYTGWLSAGVHVLVTEQLAGAQRPSFWRARLLESPQNGRVRVRWMANFPDSVVSLVNVCESLCIYPSEEPFETEAFAESLKARNPSWSTL